MEIKQGRTLILHYSERPSCITHAKFIFYINTLKISRLPVFIEIKYTPILLSAPYNFR